MSIPDPTIDPITGLPIFDASGIVQQIPLGNQTTDFASWNATAQPTRGPLFPDDGFPVFTNTQGQHPQSGNAQSIQSDGNHALKVYQVNPSSGGGGTSPVDAFIDSGSIILNAGSGTTQQTLHQFNVGTFTVVSGFRFRFQFNIPNDAAHGNHQVWLQGYVNPTTPVGQTLYLLYEVGDPWDVSDYPLRYIVERDVQLAAPIKISSTWPTATVVKMEAVCQSYRALGNGAMYYY